MHKMPRLLAALLLVLVSAASAFAQPSNITGNLTATDQFVRLGVSSDTGTVSAQVTGTFTATLTFQGTSDGTNWVSLQGWPSNDLTPVTTATAAGLWQVPVSGLVAMRVYGTSVGSGTAVVTLRGGAAPKVAGVSTGTVSITWPTAADTNAVAVRCVNTTGTVFEACGGSGSAFDGIIKDGTGDTTQANVASGRLIVDGSQVTQPVSGTVTATGPLTDTQLRATAVPVSGTVAATQSGTWTVQPGNTANTTAWLVTGTGGTFPATQSGNWSVRNQDGAGNNLTSKVAGAERALSIAIVDGSGTHITSFGGGTQYAEGATAATITGTALMWEDTADTLRSVSAAKPLPVAIISGAGSGGTAQADEFAFIVGTTNETPVGGLYLSSRDSVVTGRTGVLAMTATRALITTPEGPGGEVIVDTANTALRTSVVTVVTTQGKTQIIKEFTFADADGAQDGTTALVTIAGGSKIRVAHAMATCANSNTVSVNLRVGFAAADVGAVSTTGTTGVFLSHPGIAPGAGAATNFTGAVEGADGEDVRLEMADPVGGSCRIVLAYEVI